jgi:hypothetical protein
MRTSVQLQPTDNGLSAVVGARPQLFGIAYRMLGSAVEAEDIVQDVWLRWQTTDRSATLEPVAFLVTICWMMRPSKLAAAPPPVRTLEATLGHAAVSYAV